MKCAEQNIPIESKSCKNNSYFALQLPFQYLNIEFYVFLFLLFLPEKITDYKILLVLTKLIII